MQEERVLHEAKLAKMEAEMKMVFQQKVQEKEAKLKQSEEELYARHREMKESLEKQRLDLEEKKRKIENGRPLTPEKGTVRYNPASTMRRRVTRIVSAAENKEGFPSPLKGWTGIVRGKYTVIHAIHFMACLLLSAPPCLALVSYTPSLLCLLCLLCPGSCAVGTRHTPLHGYPWHVLPQLRLVWVPRLVLLFAGAPVALSFRTATVFLFSDSDDNFMIPLRARVDRPILSLCEMISSGNSSPCLPTTTMADIQALLAALDVFTRAPDKASLEKANAWLQDFQHSVNISPVAPRLRPLTRHHPPVLTV